MSDQLPKHSYNSADPIVREAYRAAQSSVDADAGLIVAPGFAAERSAEQFADAIADAEKTVKSAETVPDSQRGNEPATAVEVNEDMGKDELQVEAEKRGLPKTGTKAELVAAIKEYDANQA